MKEKLIQEIDRRMGIIMEKTKIILMQYNDCLDKNTMETILANQEIIRSLSYEKGKLETIVRVKKELLS